MSRRCADRVLGEGDTVTDVDFDAYLINVDALADELLAALEDLCKGIDESLYNVCTDLLVLENDSEEDHDDIDER
jgi:hypothetical protein